MTAPITIESLCHDFVDFRALSDIALEIDTGEYIVLLGPSGCGKTTLLSILGGFIVPTQGAVKIAGRDMTGVTPAKRPTTTMFQDYALFPHMTLRDNVAFGLRMRGMARRERHARAERLLELVGLHGDAGKRPHELSGGQRQRVALARALAVEPDVLLLDEPLGALDLKLRRTMQDELKSLQREFGTTFIHVTHDQEEAMAIADRIVVMNRGRIEDVGPPERVYQRPASLFAANFMGETNRLPATRGPQGLETPFGHLAPPEALVGDGPFTVCLRPEQIRSGSEGWSLGSARVGDSAFFGTHFRCHLHCDDDAETTLIAHLPPEVQPQPGARLTLSVDPARLSVFAAEESVS
nr:ABC transporter ATP-binding protein [Halomonas socia]